jgi:glycosyltransferase involved in cell wall biosynthesis
VKIAFDGKRAIQNFTGLGNYSRLLISLLCQEAPQNEYVLYAPKRSNRPLIQQFLKDSPLLRCYYATGLATCAKSLWRSWFVSRDLNAKKIDIYHGLSGELPLNISKYPGIKTVVTIHDLIFERFPQYYHTLDRLIYSYKFRKACLTADKIIAISECTKKDIVGLYHIAPEKIDVVYQGCSPVFSVPATEELKAEVKALYQLDDRFILNVGTIEERKNINLVVKALKDVPDIQFVIIGRSTNYVRQLYQTIQELGLGNRVKILQNVPFKHLPAIYQMSTLFVYPSRYEGFGIPVLEALCSGVPVIACTGSCLEEAGGPDSIYVLPYDVESMAEAINNVLSDKALRDNMIAKGKEWATKFSDSNQVEGVLKVYHSIFNENITFV